MIYLLLVRYVQQVVKNSEKKNWSFKIDEKSSNLVKNKEKNRLFGLIKNLKALVNRKRKK